MVDENNFKNSFVPNGLTRLVIVDDWSTFKVLMTALFKLLYITCTTVAPDNHKAIRFNKLFRYINKDEITTTDNYYRVFAWIQGKYFLIYDKSVSHIDNMDIIQ